MKNHRKGRLINKTNAPYVLLAPTIVLFVLFMIYPIMRSLYLSFFELKSGSYQLIGLRNYIMLFHDRTFYKSLFNTVVYLIIQVPVMISLALAIAVLIEERFLRGKAFFRTSVFLPSVTALVAYALVFKVLLNGDHGLINYVIKLFGGRGVNWFYGEWSARIAIIIAITWRWTGYNMIILLAGIQSIPDSLQEAAKIDGATAWQRFAYITVPMVKQIILFCTITSTIGTLQLFDEPFILTSGGPNNATVTMGEYLYDNGFRYLKFGYASAIGYVMTIIIFLLSVLQFKATAKGDTD